MGRAHAAHRPLSPTGSPPTIPAPTSSSPPISIHAVREVFEQVVRPRANIRCVPPMAYREFARLLAVSALAVTDSGGIQEEAAALGLPVLVMRESTERVEALDDGGAHLVGTDEDLVAKSAGLYPPVGRGRPGQARRDLPLRRRPRRRAGGEGLRASSRPRRAPRIQLRIPLRILIRKPRCTCVWIRGHGPRWQTGVPLAVLPFTGFPVAVIVASGGRSHRRRGTVVPDAPGQVISRPTARNSHFPGHRRSGDMRFCVSRVFAQPLLPRITRQKAHHDVM